MDTTGIIRKALTPVDAASLVVFRIGFGLIMFIEVLRYWQHGWISRYFIEPELHFKYYGFEWLQAWDGNGMYWHFALLGALALMLSLGLLYRLSSLLFFLGFTYVFLLDQALYLNHFYLVILIAFILCLIPAHKSVSLDRRWRDNKGNDYNSTVPLWSIWLLRAQFEILYIYAGIVKINSDWLQLEPLRMWLAERADFPLLGYLFTQDWAVAVAAYGIIILHVIGAPLLLWKKTRLAVFLLYAAFHTLNHFVFNIGIFPWLTLFGTLIFFDPDWPKQLWAKLHGQTPVTATTVPDASSAVLAPWKTSLLMSFFSLWLAFQILVPLRHWLYPGNVSWTEQGHRFAWQMKLRDKEAYAAFYVTDPVNRVSWLVAPEDHLNDNQVGKMSARPDMILQFAHYLAAYWEKNYNKPGMQVRVEARASLNGRQPVIMIDPGVDLASVQRDLLPASWILPLTEPLTPIDKGISQINHKTRSPG